MQNRFFSGLEEWLSGVTQLVDDLGVPPLGHCDTGGTGAGGTCTGGTDTSGEPDDATLRLLIETIRSERQLIEALLTRRRHRWPRNPTARRPGGIRRKARRRPIDVWPGYVDVLAALLILVIFVLLLFSFAQFLLSQLLDEQETELDVMYQRVVELTDLLGLEQENSKRLSGEVADSASVDSLLGDKRALSDDG